MFLRVIKARGGKGAKYEYVRLVQAYRDKGKTKHRVVYNLGRKDVLAAHLDALNRLLRGERRGPMRAGGEVEVTGVWDWGPMLVARTLWRELGLEKILNQLGGRKGPEGLALSDRALVLVTNRLCARSCEHGLAHWLETDFVCDRYGRRLIPHWHEEQERRVSRLPRAGIELRQLKHWDRTLDQLQAHKARIEHEVYLRLRDRSSLKVDLVLYELTPTYVGRHRPPGLGTNGYYRESNLGNPQVAVGLVMVDGWPIAHHVFSGGKWRDATTIRQVLADLEQRFGLHRVVFVGQHCMVTNAKLRVLRSRQQGYLVRLDNRGGEDLFRYVERATGEWVACTGGGPAGRKGGPPGTFVQEVASEQAGVRLFVVHSDELLALERAQRIEAKEGVRRQLAALAERVRKGRPRASDKIAAAAARIVARHHGRRFYDWEYHGGVFRYFEPTANRKREEAVEGKYIIQTEEPHLFPVEAVRIYEELTDLQQVFAELTDVTEMRPACDQTDGWVRAHIFVAFLAFLLRRAVEKKLQAAGLHLSATEALQTLRTVRVVDLDLGSNRTKRCVTRGSADAAAILHALGITDMELPTSAEKRTQVVASSS